MNKFLNGLQETNEFGFTENMAVKRTTTKSALLDMFAMGGAYRARTDEDCILLFKKALEENEVYALKCLFYLRDVRGGQGERRFWRVCMKWLANAHTEIARRNLEHTAEFGRWDDLYVFEGTPLENDAFAFIKHQLALDVQCKTPSLLAKWLKSENTSSAESRRLGAKTREYLGMTPRQYRKTLSVLRQRINVLERLMSAGEWDKIEFDKIPSRAGMIYKNAFARHDLERAKNENVQTYEDFAKDTTKKVNAKTLYPYECVAEAINVMRGGSWYSSRKSVALDDTQRLMANKYWDNLADYFNKASFNALAVVDTSGSMYGSEASAPINVAISLGLYCAEKAQGPFANHFFTFSDKPALIRTEGVDFCDKVDRILRCPWGYNTNIEAVFDLMLDTAIKNFCSQDELPENILVISDMEFDGCAISNSMGIDRWGYRRFGSLDKETLFETMKKKWRAAGYEMPKLVFWNVNARNDNIPMKDDGYVSYVSGMSPSIFETLMTGKTALDLCLDKLNSERYSVIR